MLFKIAGARGDNATPHTAESMARWITWSREVTADDRLLAIPPHIFFTADVENVFSRHHRLWKSDACAFLTHFFWNGAA